MNNFPLSKTQKRLTGIFTLLVFVIISVFGTLFFSGKYINTQRIEKNYFTQNIEIFLKEYGKNPLLFQRVFYNTQRNIRFENRRDMDRPIRSEIFRDLEFIILDNQNNIILENIGSDISDTLLQKTFQSNIILKTEGFYAFSFKSNQYNFLFFQKQMYSLNNFGKEILFFLLINFLFTSCFAFIGWYFVGRVLQPVEQNISDMNDFIHNAGHELKTPLAVTSTNLQLLSQLKNYDEDLIKNSLSEIQRMDNLIVGLSQLSDIQSFSHQEKFSLLESIEQIISEYQAKILKKNITLNKDFENISFFGNKAYFEILFSNLLSNAIKYNRENGEITISLTKKYLKIENTGNIITDEQKEKIFDRFYRIETVRNSEGFGIGLSLVKKVCEIFSWKISVTSTKVTNIFTIEF